MVANSSVCRGLVIGVMLISGVSYADRAMLPSAASLRAENERVIVTHEHDLQFSDADDGLSVEWNSTLRIVSKSDGTEILDARVMPLTALVKVGDGGYFAGLSTLKALAFRYNFVLFADDGRVITTALVTPTSGHCRTVSFTTTNFIRWFDEEDPDVVTLSMKDGQIDEIIVRNPYDRPAGVGPSGVCVIPVEPPVALDPSVTAP